MASGVRHVQAPQLPAGWERRCLEAALSGAGFQYRFHDTPHGVATLRYGPDAGTSIELAVSVAPGAFRVLAPAITAPSPPSLDSLRRANDASIDWNGGRIGFDPSTRSFSAMSTVFAYPDYVPPRDTVQWLCHSLWASRDAVRTLAPPVDVFDAVTEAERARIVERFGAAGVPLQSQGDGAFAQRFDTGDDGAIGLRLSFEGGAVIVDALPLRCPAWPETLESMTAMLSLNHRLMAGAVTRWGKQIVIRQSVPLPFVPDHAQWVVTTIDAASWAALDVVRLARGGALERPLPS
jgi:hypothetical protein